MKKKGLCLLIILLIVGFLSPSLIFAQSSKIIVTLKPYRGYNTEGVILLDGKAQAGGSAVSSIRINTTPGKHTISVNSVTYFSKGMKKSLKYKSKTVKVKAGETKNVTFKWIL